jgi:division protein CdvB (Snf7/Vps24/ESCRT-III family)
MKDTQIKKLMDIEKKRQKKVINLIASENYVSNDVKRQKIETDMRLTISKLDSVISRVQVIIDLLNKNNRNTTDATKFLVDARLSLKNATEALDQFVGVIIPEVKVDTKLMKTDEKTTAVVKPAPASLKDPLKKSEDSLKDSKASIISSIEALKESLITTKDSQ